MSEVVFAGCRSIAVNAATRISVNGLIRLFARETRFPVFIRTQIQMVVANASSGWIFQVYPLWKGVEERPRHEGMFVSRIS